MSDLPLAHRDDLPFEMVEELTAEFQKKFPGIKLVFAGDIPTDQELPAGLSDEIANIDRVIKSSMSQGLCMDCGEQIPGDWPLESSDPFPENWHKFFAPGSDQFFLVCPACFDAKPDFGDVLDVEGD